MKWLIKVLFKILKYYTYGVAGLFCLLAPLTLFGGCAGAPPVPVVQDHFIAPPEALLVPCQAAEPPDPSAYVTWTWEQKETALTNVIIAQNSSIKTCNDNHVAIEDWVTKNQAIYDAPPTGSK